MAGIFHKFPGRSGGHRRSKSTDANETSPANLQASSSMRAATNHGIEMEGDFKLMEQPMEPHSQDEPVRCPLPEPSILNDGRIWKAHMSSVNARVRTELPVVMEGPHVKGREARPPKPAPATQKRILPSLSAPESAFLTLLSDQR